jgi:hypothetical protein
MSYDMGGGGGYDDGGYGGRSGGPQRRSGGIFERLGAAEEYEAAGFNGYGHAGGFSERRGGRGGPYDMRRGGGRMQQQGYRPEDEDR